MTSTILLTFTIATLGCEAHGHDPDEFRRPPVELKVGTDTTAHAAIWVANVRWSADGGIVHYRFHRRVKRPAAKAGRSGLGYFVDVFSKQVLGIYRVEMSGHASEKVKNDWRRAKPREWGERILKDHGFVETKRSTKAPGGAGRLRLDSARSAGGRPDTWPQRRSLWWVWRPSDEEPEREMSQELSLVYLPRRGAKRVLAKHVPYLDYRFAERHRDAWTDNEWRDKQNTKACLASLAAVNACERELRVRGITKGNEFAFRGEVRPHWNPQGDAVLVFWDDRQAIDVGEESATAVWRAHVTIHNLGRRGLARIPWLQPAQPKVAAPVMPVAKLAKGALAASAAAGSSGRATRSRRHVPAWDGVPQPPPVKKQSGCGCRAAGAGPTGGVIALGFGLLLLLALRRRARAAS